jgi:hypothetical protein
MATKTANRLDGDFAAALARVQPTLAEWRKRRKHREPIPETLWRPMGALARRYGLSPVARALRVNYTALKRHTPARPIPEARRPGAPSTLHSPPSAVLRRTGATEDGSAQFVEVPTGGWSALPSGQWGIELEDRRGFKLTLRLPQGQHAATLALAQGLWRHRR